MDVNQIRYAQNYSSKPGKLARKRLHLSKKANLRLSAWLGTIWPKCHFCRIQFAVYHSILPEVLLHPKVGFEIGEKFMLCSECLEVRTSCRSVLMMAVFSLIASGFAIKHRI